MTALLLAACAACAALPLAGALVVRRARDPRAWALGATGVTFAVALALLGASAASDHAVLAAHARAGRALDLHVVLDGLGAVLLPLTSGLALLLVAALPRSAADRRALAQLLVVEAGLLGCLVAMDAAWFCALWLLGLAPAARDAWRSPAGPLRRATLAALAAMALPVVAATAGVARAGLAAGLPSALDLADLARRGAAPGWIGAALLVAALARMGVVPLHLWVGPAFERGPAPALLCAAVTPLGSFVLARTAWPLAPEVFRAAAPALVAVGLATALYGTLLAAAQRDLRRLVAAFLVSQRGLLLVGLAGLNAQSVAGALLHAVAEVFAVSGLALVAVAVAARTGTADVRALGGLVRPAPAMAAAWLVFSAAAVGFPGTMAFISEDLLVEGLLRAHGVVAVTLLVTSAVNGVTLYRAFTRAFLGPPSAAAEGFDDLLSRERRAVAVLAVAVVLGGFVPGPFLALRQGVVDALARAASPAAPAPVPAPVPMPVPTAVPTPVEVASW